MKTASFALFELINSLSSSEKRYLKLGLNGKQHEHLKLFDAIVGLEEYDEEVLKNQYPDSRFVRNLPVYKSYLYQYILNRLAQFHEKGETAEVFECLRFAEVLNQKKLHAQATKQLEKAGKLARKYYLPEMMLVVSKMRRELMSQGNRFDYDKNQVLYLERNWAIKELDLNNEFSRLFNEVSQLQIQFQKASKPAEIAALKKWREQPLLQKEESGLSVANRILLLKSLAIYHFTLDEPWEASVFNKKILNLLETETTFNKKYPEQYLSALNNFIIDQLTLKNIKAFEEGLTRLEKVPENPVFASVKDIKTRMFHQRYLLFFNYCFSAGDFEKAMVELPEFEKGMQEFENKLKFHQRLTLYYLAAVLSFGAKRFEDARRWLFPILQETRAEVVTEIFRHARLLNLLVHFELGNFEYLESLLLSTQRVLMKKGGMSQSEKMILRFLKRCLQSASAKVITEHAKELLQKITLLPEDPREQRLLDYIPLKLWLEKSFR